MIPYSRKALWCFGGISVLAVALFLVLQGVVLNGDDRFPWFVVMPGEHLPENDARNISTSRTRGLRHETSVFQCAEDVRNADLHEAFFSIRAQGDYSGLERFLGSATESERTEILIGSLGRLYSRLGNQYDVTQKLSLIGQFGDSVSIDASEMVMRDLGARIDLERDLEYLRSIDASSWRFVAVGAAQNRPEKAFELAEMDLHDEQTRILIIEATKAWLDLDSIAASEFIGAMRESPNKTIAVREIVKWLVAHGEVENAQKWKLSL